MIPLLVVTPLTFLGGSFYSIDMLPPFWRIVTLVNPVVYLVSGFRWSFYSVSDVSVAVSLGMTLVFLAVCLAIVDLDFQDGLPVEDVRGAPSAFIQWRSLRFGDGPIGSFRSSGVFRGIGLRRKLIGRVEVSIHRSLHAAKIIVELLHAPAVIDISAHVELHDAAIALERISKQVAFAIGKIAERLVRLR